MLFHGDRIKRAPMATKIRFSLEDDQALSKAVLNAIDSGADASNINWIQISKMVPGKSSRQCRERWQNYLRPNLTDKIWTREEDTKLMNLFKRYGHFWTKIASFLPGRTGNSVRNRYLRLVRQQNKAELKQYQMGVLRKAFPFLTNRDLNAIIEEKNKQKNPPCTVTKKPDEPTSAISLPNDETEGENINSIPKDDDLSIFGAFDAQFEDSIFFDIF